MSVSFAKVSWYQAFTSDLLAQQFPGQFGAHPFKGDILRSKSLHVLDTVTEFPSAFATSITLQPLDFLPKTLSPQIYK